MSEAKLDEPWLRIDVDSYVMLVNSTILRRDRLLLNMTDGSAFQND